MLILRLVFVFAVVSVGACALLYIFTRDRRYLKLVGRIVSGVAIFVAMLLAFYLIERVFIVI